MAIFKQEAGSILVDFSLALSLGYMIQKALA
jgi:hypothetical protein